MKPRIIFGLIFGVLGMLLNIYASVLIWTLCGCQPIIFLAGGAIILNRSERAVERQIAEDRTKEDRKLAEDRAKLDREIATDRQQEAALQAYIDRISELLLKEKLLTTKTEEVRDVARTRTLSVIRWLDTRRSNFVVQFLREANLITNENSILNRANMKGMNLQGLDLSQVLA